MYQTVFVQSIISEDLAFTGSSQKTLLPFSTDQCIFCGTQFNCYCPKSPHPNYYRTVLDTWISAPIPTLLSVVGFKNYMFPKKLPESFQLQEYQTDMLNCKLNSTNGGTVSNSAETNYFIVFLFQRALVMSK